MDLSGILNQGGTVKIEVSVDDLLRFAEYVVNKCNKENSSYEKAPPEYGGVDLAMDVTGYAESSIRNMVSKKQIPFKKVHGKIWFKRTDLLEWINSVPDDSKLLKYMK